MKKVFLLICFHFAYNGLIAQDRFIKDSMTGYKVIHIEKESLQGRGINDFLFIFDDSGKIAKIWKEKKKYKADLLWYKPSEENSTNKKLKLCKKDKSNIESIFNNLNNVLAIRDMNCFKGAHTFTKIHVYVVNGDNDIKHSFFSHCGTEEQRNKASDILSLYHSLINGY